MENKILFVDDEHESITVLIEILRQEYDYEIVEMSTYADGLAFALENIGSIKLAILDGLDKHLGSEIGVKMRTGGSKAVICMHTASPVEKVIPDPKNIPLFDAIFEKASGTLKIIQKIKELLPA